MDKNLICEQTMGDPGTGGKINEQKRRKHLQKKDDVMGSQIYQRASINGRMGTYGYRYGKTAREARDKVNQALCA